LGNCTNTGEVLNQGKGDRHLEPHGEFSIYLPRTPLQILLCLQELHDLIENAPQVILIGILVLATENGKVGRVRNRRLKSTCQYFSCVSLFHVIFYLPQLYCMSDKVKNIPQQCYED